MDTKGRNNFCSVCLRSFKTFLSANIPLFSAAEVAEQKYIDELSGEITDETFSKIDSIAEQLDKAISDYEYAKIDFENGKITKSQLNLFARDEAAARSSKEGLDRVKARVNELKTNGADKGFIPWLIDETPFESVYGTAAQDNQHHASVIAVLSLTLLLAGSMVYERRSNIRSCKANGACICCCLRYNAVAVRVVRLY